VCRRLDLAAQLVGEIRKTLGFDEATYTVSKDHRPRKIAVTFVTGSDSLPEFGRLRSANPRVDLVLASGPARALVSLYDRPKRGGDFGEPNRAVERALAQAGMPAPIATTRSLRVIFELMSLATSLARPSGRER
jgi:hypothetical protein